MSNSINKRIRTKEFEDGKRLTITVLGATEGVLLANKLAKTFIPAYKQLYKPDGKFDLMEAFQALVEGLGEIELNKVIARLFASATVNDFPLNTDEYFSANYGELIDFLGFALTENFGSFFKNTYTKQFSEGE